MAGPGWTDETAVGYAGGGGPIAARLQLGAWLRRLREARGLSRAEAAEPIRASASKISRIELGRVGFKERDLADLLTLYEVAEPERSELLACARDARQPGWWDAFREVTPSWLRTYLGLEGAACLIKTYETRFVPELLQTERYARAVVRLERPGIGDDEVERLVGLRMCRQQDVLGRADPPRLWAVVDEAVLHRPVGGRAVLRDQLEALATWMVKVSPVRLQVLPLATGGYAPAGGSFTILRFPDAQLPDVAYVDQLIGAVRVERSSEVERYGAAAGRLYSDAAPPHRTVKIIDDILAGAGVPLGDGGV